MATVTGITAEKAAEIENASIVDGFLSGSNLILRTRGGSEINVGAVKASVLDSWPVGSIFVNYLATSPATLLGGGTWVRFGEGRVLVSQNGADTDFDVAGDVGGEKTHTLTEAEMPNHRHTNDHDLWAENPGSNDWEFDNLGGDPDTRIPFVRHATINTTYTGGGGAHNNLQPFIVVYMWRRTA